MTIRRREFLGSAAGALAAGLRPAFAQYPERNLTLIVPYGAAGTSTSSART